MSRTHLASLMLTLSLFASCNREDSVARLPESSSAPTAKPAHELKPAAPPAAPTFAAGKAASNDPAAASDAIPPPPPGSSFLSGQTEAHRRSTLTPKVASIVTRVHVRDGDIVKNGQALVTLDRQDFSLRTQQAEAALQAAKVQLDSAKLDWDRTKALLGD